jgi:hypothetical protein
MRRCLDLLIPRGLGVFVIPAGFLSGSTNRKLRERVLLRHHLEVAFRLPSESTTGKDLFPGAHNVVDVLFWRARGGELRQVDPGDGFILEGDYFKEHPAHILGTEVEEEAGKKRHRYAVVGDFTGFPAFTPRPVCESCAITNLPTFEVTPVTTVTRDMGEDPGDAGDDLRQALNLGRRVDRYLALVAAEDPRATGLWRELSEALQNLKRAPALAAHDGNPWRWPELRALAERRALAQRLLAAYQKTGELAPAVALAPNIQPKFRAQPGDVLAQAEHLHRSRRRLTIDELEAFHKSQGGLLDRGFMVRQLLDKEWNLDGDDLGRAGPFTRLPRRHAVAQVRPRGRARSYRPAGRGADAPPRGRDELGSVRGHPGHLAAPGLGAASSSPPTTAARDPRAGTRLKAHQIAGILRVLDMRGGLIAFDVGVGKTYTAIGVIAAARQEGWVRRPVVLVPSSLVWKWHDDILCVLPDYRVLVIGSKRKRISRGERKGLHHLRDRHARGARREVERLPGRPLDVVILSYDALAPHQDEPGGAARVRQAPSRPPAPGQAAPAQRRQEEGRQPQRARQGDPQARRARLGRGDARAARGPQVRPRHRLGRHRHRHARRRRGRGLQEQLQAEAREDGVPKFMGSGGDGSKRAWQLDFRAAAVRRAPAAPASSCSPRRRPRTARSSSTTSSSSSTRTRSRARPDPDPEQFIDRFLRIESREIIDMTFKVSMRSVVDGFKNLDDLRTIIFRYGEFRTGAEVGLTLPEPRIEQVRVPLGPEQEDLYGELVRKLERTLQQSQIQGSSQNKILGLLARLSLVALHAKLDGGVEYNQALSSVSIPPTTPRPS